PAPKPEPKPEPKKEAVATKEAEAKKPAPKPEPKPEETVDASKELEKSLAKLRSKVDEQQRLDSALDRLEKKFATKSNQVGGAYSAGGGGGSTSSVRDQVYLTELWSRIQAAWVLSEALVQKPRGLVAIVGLRIRKDGSLEKTWLEQSSGNTRYDQSALRATERAAPFPPPPAGMRESYFEVGVRFRVEDLGG
ncbi:MAG: TonB C-terminal domain-containing protein, partial [Desulfarculus sp.]|nr:TonB C-terminal domain-containing protein [Desulfarculus sp.]